MLTKLFDYAFDAVVTMALAVLVWTCLSIIGDIILSTWAANQYERWYERSRIAASKQDYDLSVMYAQRAKRAVRVHTKFMDFMLFTWL